MRSPLWWTLLPPLIRARLTSTALSPAEELAGRDDDRLDIPSRQQAPHEGAAACPGRPLARGRGPGLLGEAPGLLAPGQDLAWSAVCRADCILTGHGFYSACTGVRHAETDAARRSEAVHPAAHPGRRPGDLPSPGLRGDHHG